MYSLKNLINHNKQNIIFGIITVVCIMGLYSFFSYTVLNDSIEILKNPKPIVDENNPPVVFSPVLIKTDSINDKRGTLFQEKLNSEGKNFVEINDSDIMSLRELFKDSIINKHTIKITDALRLKFGDSIDDMNTHFRQVEDFIRTQINDEAKVRDLMSFYSKYTKYEMDQVYDPHPLWMETPENPDAAIALNTHKQGYLRGIFGQDVADTLWGHEMKAYEYKMKELEILRENIYGAQVKEQLIADLRKEYFESDDTASEQNTPMDYDAQLYVKLAIYADELMAMTDEERNNKIREFRNEIYPSGQAEQMEILDGQ